MRVSHSALETYLTCPQKYKFQEIDKIRVPKSKEAIFGTAIHNALRYMFMRDPLFPTVEEVIAHFRESFLSNETIAEEDKARYVQSGEKMIRQFYLKNPPWNFQIVDLESRFEVPLEDPVYGVTHMLVGNIDRIDKHENGTFEIIDYKTSRKLPAQSEVDKNAQLSIYQLALQKKWPHVDPEQISLSLYFLKSGEKLSTRRTKEALAKTETKILSNLHTIEKKMEENDFPPVPSALCDWCGYKPICPAWRHLYKKEELPPEEQAKIDDLVTEYFSLKKEIDEREDRLSALTKAINAYFDAEGVDRVFGADGSLMRSAQERTSWNTEKIEEILRDNPVWDSLLSVDTKKIKKALAALPYELQERIKNEAQIIKKFMMLKASKKKEKIS